jgi:hypothetical protein
VVRHGGRYWALEQITSFLTSVRELGVPNFGQGRGLCSGQAWWEVLGFRAILGSKLPGTIHRVTGYLFPPFSGESVYPRERLLTPTQWQITTQWRSWVPAL